MIDTKNYRILGFDASTNSCSVCISLGRSIIAYEQELQHSMQAESLVFLIENALRSVNYKYEDIDYLAVTTGPGSFTGIRVGIATARGILLSSDIKGLGITNFEIFYSSLLNQVRHFDKAVILLKAYRNQTYYQEFFSSNRKGKMGLIENNKIFQLLFLNKKEKIVCIGNAANEIYHQIDKEMNITVLPLPTKISAIQICKYVNKKAEKGLLSEKSENIAPLYIRKPDSKIHPKRKPYLLNC